MTELERQLQLRALFEQQHVPRIARLLIATTNAVAARVAAGDGVDVALREVDDRATALRVVIEAHVKRTASAFAQHTWKVFADAARKEWAGYREGRNAFAAAWTWDDSDRGRQNALWDRLFGVGREARCEWGDTSWMRLTKDRESVFLRARDAFAEQYAAEEVVQINQTTKDRIRKIVTDALKEQLGVRQIAKKIIAHVNGIANMTARARAHTIGRTETHNASNAGADQAARATGLKYEREWLSAEDARVRPAHAAAHGQRRSADEPFNVGGYTMDRPGSGPASQVINCRCTLAFHPVLSLARAA